MRKSFFSLLLIMTFNLVFCQEKTQDFYLEKSKKLKTIGWILVGTGTAAIITGVVVDNVKKGPYMESSAGGAIELIGFPCVLVSVPCFIYAAKNKKKALEFSFIEQRIFIPLRNISVKTTQPAISLSLKL
jgi:hypothetical protein